MEHDELDAALETDELATPDTPAETPAPERGPRSRTLLPALAAGLLVVAVAALVITRAERAPVSTPFVIGMQVPAAKAALRSAELTPGALLVRVEPGYPSGRIIEQSPVAATEIARHSRVNLVVAQPSVPATVPDLGLAPVAQATRSLLDDWFTPVESSQLSSSVPFGRVISQLPAPGTTLMSQARVALVVSEGPGKGGVPVPNLVGKKAAQAAAILAEIHLFPAWINVSTTTPTETPTGVVTGQAVAPGGHVQLGSKVALTLVLPK